MVRSARRFLALLAIHSLGCTYGPEERAATVEQVVRIDDSYLAIVVVRHDTFRRPTGLAAFPDGGAVQYLRRGAAQYLVDARGRSLRPLARQDAPDEVWVSFQAWIAGMVGDSVAYLRLTGCPRGGECYPGLDESIVYRLPLNGSTTRVPAVPPDASLPGGMAARRPGERSFVRFGTRRDTVAARFEEDGPLEPLFVAGPDGSLRVLGR